MSRSPSRHRLSSRYLENINSNVNLATKFNHRYYHEDDSRRDHHTRKQYSREHNKRQHSSRRTPEESNLGSKHRSRRPSGNMSPDHSKRHCRRDPDDEPYHHRSYSKSPRCRRRYVNKEFVKDKDHFSFSSSSKSSNSLNRVDVNNDASIESFSPFVPSPISPNSSFGKSLFDHIPDRKFSHFVFYFKITSGVF